MVTPFQDIETKLVHCGGRVVEGPSACPSSRAWRSRRVVRMATTTCATSAWTTRRTTNCCTSWRPAAGPCPWSPAR